MKTEPVVYGALFRDPNAPDGWSGLQVFFRIDTGGRLTADLRESGANSRTRRADQVSYDVKTDSLTLTYDNPGSTRFTRMYRPSCDRLVGFATYFMSPTDTNGILVADTLPRVQSKS